MAIDYTALFTALGKIFKQAELVDTDVLAGTYAGDGPEAIRSYLSAARTLLIDRVNRDNPAPKRELRPSTIELIRQMVVDGKTINRATGSIAATALNTNTGNGVMLVYASGLDGVNWQNNRNEDIEARCTFDERVKNDPRLVRFALRGEGSVPFDRTGWRRGSGVEAEIFQCTADEHGFSRIGKNAITNGNFEQATSGFPDQFEAVVNNGTIGVTSTAQRGSQALKITGDGATLTDFRQKLGDTSYSPGRLIPGMPHLLSLAIRHDNVGGVAPAAGVLDIMIYDGSSALYTSTLSIPLTGITASYVEKHVYFNVPLSRGSTMYWRAVLTTAITNTRAVFIDDAICAPMYPLFPNNSAPFVLPVAGSTGFAIDDVFTIGVVNNNEGKFSYWFDRAFDMQSMGLSLPSSATPNISDSLVA